MTKKTNYFFLLIVINLVSISLCIYYVRQNHKLLKQQSIVQKPLDPSSYSFFFNPNYLEQLDLNQVYPSSHSIVMLGNSHTYKINWNELLHRNDIINFGIGSDITEGYLYRIQSVVNQKPKICCIEGGINDIVIGIHPQKTIQFLSQILDVLNAKGIKPILCTIMPVHQSFPNAYRINEKVWWTNAIIQKIAQSKKVEVLDLYEKFSSSGFLNASYAQKDGIHINANAYKIWADLLVEKFKVIESK